MLPSKMIYFGSLMTKFLLQLFLFLFTAQTLAAQCDHTTSRTQNSLSPDFILRLNPRKLSENSAFSLMGEAGKRNFRASGTFGFIFGNDHRFKITTEWLKQKLAYNFSTGRINQWFDQFAAGAVYGHRFYCNRYLAGIEASGFGSYVKSKDLNQVVCVDRIVSRHLAGSSAFGFSAGLVFTPTHRMKVKLSGNYDVVIYHRKFGLNRHVNGFGGSFDFFHQLPKNFGLNVIGEFRRPFNYLKATLLYCPPGNQGLSVGVFASHFNGRSKLPSSSVIGLEASYTFGEYCLMATPESYQGLDVFYYACRNEINPELKCWVARPAVYMPQVLAIPEEVACEFVTSSPIPNAVITAAGVFVINAAPFFTSPNGSPLTFSATGLPAGATINPSTGLISGLNPQDGNTYTIIVTASNTCSSTSQAFTIRFPAVAPG